MSEENKKRCSNCGLHKPLDEFHVYVGKTARSKDGYRTECKKCRNKKRLEYYHRTKGGDNG